MGPQFQGRTKLRHDEQGIYVLLVAIVLVTLLTLVGLGIDAGRLYISGLRQQGAADAGALSGAYFIGRYLPWEARALPPEEIRSVALQVAQDNLESSHIPYNSGNPTQNIGITYDPVVHSDISVSVDANTESLIVGKVVPGADSTVVATEASATRWPVAVTLVLDVTGSMGELDGSGNIKMNMLKIAANNFVRRFDPTRDWISVVTYSWAPAAHPADHPNPDPANLRDPTNPNAPVPSKVIYPLIPGPGHFTTYPSDLHYDTTVIEQRINALFPNGWTSIHAGLLEGFREAIKIDKVSLPLRPKKIIVLITDGAPNHNQRPGETDSYYPVTGDGGLAEDFAGLPTCNDPDPANCTYSSYPAYPAGCPKDTHVNDLRDNFIDSVITADLIRKAGITLLTVAIGPNDPADIAQEPFGTQTDFTTIKQVFMRRLANDAKGAAEIVDPHNPTRNKPKDADFPAACVPDYDGIVDMPGGRSLISPDSGNLDNMLQEIANEILMRLTA